MSNLFSVIPENFFNPLAASGNVVYIEALLKILSAAQRHHLPLSRELVMDQILSCLVEQPNALTLTDEAFITEEGWTSDADEASLLAAKANAVLRYLTRCGWLRGETQADFAHVFIIPDYAFKVLLVLQEITRNQPPPLRGLICSIHDLLQAALREGGADVRLPEAHRQTVHLLNGLKELQHNIGLHIERLLQQKRTNEVMVQLFSDYRTEVVDRAYHQLRTTDHVSRYRPDIILSTTKLENGEHLSQAARRLYELGEAESLEEALTRLKTQLREVREQLEALDRLLQAIDTRHSHFVDAAVRLIELQLAAGTTTSGQLHDILEKLLAETDSQKQEALIEAIRPLLRTHSLELLDSSSLAQPTRAPSSFAPEPEIPFEPSPEEIEREREKTLGQMMRAISRRRVREWMNRQMQGRDEMRASELSLTGPEELPLLIYARVYGDGTLGYRVIENESAQEGWIEREQLGFRDFTIQAVQAEESL